LGSGFEPPKKWWHRPHSFAAQVSQELSAKVDDEKLKLQKQLEETDRWMTGSICKICG
jgi:hypothetical protein